MNTRNYFWRDWLVSLTKHLAVPQSDETRGVIKVWFYDRSDEHTATMWRGEVPYTLLDTYSQATNDEDVAAFDAMVAAETFNKPIDQLNYEGRLITQPVTLGSGQWHYWHSEGDDLENNTVRGGPPFEAEVTSASDLTVTWGYRDPVWIAGGWFKYKDALLGDYVRFTIFAPATEVVANGSNTGNCNLVSGVYIVPSNGGNTGAYDVDLNLANPIPTSDAWPYTGYWDYTLPSDMKYRGVLTPGEPGHAKYILLAARADLDCFVGNGRLLDAGKNVYSPDNIKVSLCLPGWKFECVVHNENGTNTLQAIWEVLVSRYWTT